MSDKNISVSIIVPMFNAEKHIKQCLDSVRTQNFAEYELIVVDDCSTDRSVEIVESMIDRFNGRLMLIKRNENSGGAAAPRNDALKRARGKYVTFLDNDDLLAKNALQTLFDTAEKYNADVVHAEKHLSTNADTIEPDTKMTLIFNTKMPVDKIRLESDDLAVRIREYRQNLFFANWVVWNKLFRRDFLIEHHIEFPDLHVADDMMFSFFCLCRAKTYVHIPDALYIYRVRDDSFSREPLEPSEQLHKWASLIIKGVKIMDDFMSGVDFFNRHEQFRQMALDLFVQFHFDYRMKPLYSKFKSFELEKMLREEFAREPDGSIALSAYLFNLSNVCLMRIQKLTLENAQLKSQLAQLKAGAKKTLRTWDIFDTLIARRCITPDRVFNMLERRIKVKGFAVARMKAEQMLIKRGRPFKLDDIYDELLKASHVDKNVADGWKKAECEIELEQAIPIVENINKVRSGDVLISDMYLPDDVIRRMLEKCGLFVPVELIITNSGKSGGAVWKQLRDQGVYLSHVGDNQQSDVKKPREFQFASSWSILNRLNQFESDLTKIDFEFAAYLRSIRLANPFDEEIKHHYWTLFVINVGCLMLTVQLLDMIQKHYGFEHLGFCGRDTYYMRQLYQRLKRDRNEAAPSDSYLYYSRKLLANSEADLIKYFSSEINGRRSLLIDLTGSGVHLNILRDKARLNFSLLLCLLIGRTESAKIYPSLSQFLSDDWLSVKDGLSTPTVEPPKNLCLFDLEKDNLPLKDDIELFNRATHNSPLRMTALEFNGKVIPEVTFSEINDTENLDVFETCMKTVLQSKIRWSKLERVEDILAALKGMLIFFAGNSQRLVLKQQQNLQELTERMLRGSER